MEMKHGDCVYVSCFVKKENFDFSSFLSDKLFLKYKDCINVNYISEQYRIISFFGKVSSLPKQAALHFVISFELITKKIMSERIYLVFVKETIILAKHKRFIIVEKTKWR